MGDTLDEKEETAVDIGAATSQHGCGGNDDSTLAEVEEVGVGTTSEVDSK